MREFIHNIQNWPEPVALATVVSTWDSAPRQVGAKLAMAANHKLSGSVSGGCIEELLHGEGLDMLRGSTPRLVAYTISDETAFETLGLARGGRIEVFVEPLTAQLREFWLAAVDKDQTCAVSTVIGGEPDLLGYKVMLDHAHASRTNRAEEGYDARMQALKIEMISKSSLCVAEGVSRRMLLADGGTEIFVDVQLPAPQLVLIGAAHIAQTLLPIAQSVGFRVVVCDPRLAFANELRFPDADLLVRAFPPQAFEQIHITRSTAIVALTHDNTLDDAALFQALTTEAFYVGALGGGKASEQRRARLLKRGLTELQLNRLHAPLGLEIGARSADEIALAVMAQIIAARNHVAYAPRIAQ